MITKQHYTVAYLTNRFPFAIGNLRWNWKKPPYFVFLHIL